MSGRARGRLAVVGLALVIAGFGVALATTRGARIRFLAWRMRSSDRMVRVASRRKLLEIGRPEIDRFLPDIVAGEVSDRFEGVPALERVVIVGDDPPGTIPTLHYYGLPPGSLRRDLLAEKPSAAVAVFPNLDNGFDLVAMSIGRIEGHPEQWLVVGQRDASNGVAFELLTVPLPREEALARSVLAETRARVAALP